MRDRLLALLAFTTLIAAANAQLPRALISEEYDPAKKNKTQLSVTPLFDQLPPSGYFPIRVYIFNDAKNSRTWNFEWLSEDSSYSSEGNQLRSSSSVTCAAGKSTEVDLLVPLVTSFQYGYSSTSLSIRVNAPAPLPGSSNSLTTYYDEAWPAALISESLNNRNRGTLATAVGGMIGGSSPGYGTTAGIEFGAAFNPKKMPEDWRSYSGFDACLLTEDDWNALLSGSQNALLKWNRLGGSLVIYTSNSGTNLATLKIDSASGGSARKGIRSWGTVRVRSMPSTQVIEPVSAVNLVASEIPRETGGNRLRSLRRDFCTSWPLQLKFGSVATNILFFILILIAFGILVGPVNLFVFARAGQRHRLFITTPIISLAASALLVVLILFQDGFGGRGVQAVLMEIGPGNTAYISQEQIARTGVLLNTSFTTDESGYLTPVMIDESRWARVTQENHGGKGRYIIDARDDGMRVTGDWFKSRSEHGHLFETIRPTRARVSLVRDANPPVINSTFEFALETVYYRDSGGRLWTGENIQQGRNTTLSPSSEAAFNTWLNTERSNFANRNQQRIELNRKHNRYFFAATTDAPGLETLGAINWKETYTLITGAVAAP